MKPTPRKERLFLIDGMAIAYRSYFAFIQRPLINSRGENTSAIYGFVMFLNKILEEEQPDYIAVAMDTSAPTFRHVAYKEYKATRQKMPEDMASQLETLRELVRSFGIPVLEVPGFEADDIMGTLARRAEREPVETYLVTPDKDFLQLISEKIRIYRPARQGNDAEIIDERGVAEKFGVEPERVVDVLGLIGDKSDNVPGVPGIGEKTAIPLIQQYGTIENLLQNAEAIPQKGVREKLLANREKALLSKQLVTIKTDVPLSIDFHELKIRKKDPGKIVRLYELLEFKSLLKKLDAAGTDSASASPAESEPPEYTDIKTDRHSYSVIRTTREFQQLCSALAGAPRFVVDVETTSTNPLRAQIVGISFCVEERKAFYVPVASERNPAGTDLFGTVVPAERNSGKEEGLPPAVVFEGLKRILEDPRIRKIGQNIKYDMLALSRTGIWINGVEFDTMVASYILRGDGQHNLDSLAKEHLRYAMVSFDDLTGTGKERKDIRDVPLSALSDYSCEDADITMRLSAVLRKRLDEQGMAELASRMEFPLIPVLARMEHAGVAIDVEYLRDMSKELERMLDNLTREIYSFAGGPFNVNSTQQLSEVLFTKLKLAPARKTKTGFSTDVAVLESLRDEHPIIEKLLEYRQLAKLKSTYVDALPALIHPDTGRVHTSFNQTVAATGRLSSSDPNLQNIPIRTEIGRSIRRAFVARGDRDAILSADYSQIELRVMAHVCSDEGLKSAFVNGEDIHATTAAKIFGIDPKDVTKDMRRKAKEVNFGIMYGIGAFGLSRRLEISQTEGKEIIDRYFERFPSVRQYIQETIEKARRDGYVSTLLGRRRYLPDIHSRNGNIRGNAERQAINMPIQGTAADMIKLAMVHIDREMQERKLRSLMILQVHDELVFNIEKSEEEEMRELIRRNMSGALELSVPLEVEIGVGSNWLEAH